jgi:short-subunit dehydrogenase
MENQKNRLHRPFAVVTGASRGIGFELAKRFAKNGFDLLIAAEDIDINQAAEDLRKYSTHVQSFQVDLTEYDGVERLYSQIRSHGRPVDALAINAGVGVGGDFSRDTDLHAELGLIDLNVKSTVHLAKLAVKDMLKSGKGRILFTSSVVSMMPGPFEAVYAASKAFVQSFAQALRNELKETDITITALMPGATETDFFHRAGLDNTKVGQAEKDDPALVAEQGYEALMSGKDHVVAGSFKNRLQTTIAKFIPQRFTAEIHRGMAKPGSAKKKAA